MDRICCLVLVTLFSAFLPAIAAAQSPRVMVELAFVTRVRLSTDQSPLKEEFEKQLEDAERDREGLVPFLDDWLTGKDRDLHEVDLMQLKIPLDEEVEFVTRHSLPAEFEDPKEMFEGVSAPMRPEMGLIHGGLSAIVKAKKHPDGKIHVRFRLLKKNPAVMAPSEDDEGSDRRPLPIMRTQWTDTELDLDPRDASAMGGLLQSTIKDGKEVTRELAILVRVHMADPAPFPVD